MSDKAYVLATEAVEVGIILDPVFVAVDFLSDMAHLEYLSGISHRVQEIANSISPDRRHINAVIFEGLYSAMGVARPWGDMNIFIKHLEDQDAVEMRDHAIEWMCEHDMEGITPLTKEVVLENRQAYLDKIEEIYLKKKAEKGMRFDEALYTEIHHWLTRPYEMKELIITHLRFMWDNVLAAEWKRILPLLQETVDAFYQIDFTGLSALEAIRVVTGRDLSVIWPEWTGHLLFIPTPYIGPYVGRYESEDKESNYVMFGARPPEGARMVSPALSRSELVVRMNALADDTRLRIVELMTRYDELCAQDIITLLDLSQSAASRHLRQLTATGYLIERRREVSKCYSLNRERFEDTMRALRRFVRTSRTIGVF